MNLQGYAAHRKARGLRGTSHVAVLQAIQSGRLTEPAARKIDGRWHIDASLADAQWAGNTNAAPPPDPSARNMPHPAGGGPSMADAKRMRAIYQAERERLAVMREKGELILADTVKAEAARLARQVRDLLLMIPARCAAQAAALTDPEEVRDLLEREIEQALRGLADA